MTVVIQQRIIECPYRRSEIEYHKCTYLLVMHACTHGRTSSTKWIRYDGSYFSPQVDMGSRQSKG